MHGRTNRSSQDDRHGIVALSTTVALVAALALGAWGVSAGASESQGGGRASASAASTADGAASSAATASYPDVGLPASGYPKDGTYKSSLSQLDDLYSHASKDADNAQANAPRTYVDRNGFTVQPTPDDGLGWNVSYLNADQRGCTSCHTLEDALMSLPTYHRLIFEGYPTEQTLANCIVCHSWSPTPLKDTIHSLHMGKATFQAMGGSCESCHYIDADGNFLRWDYVKYDVEHGITDVAAEDVLDQGFAVSYDQDTVTDFDQMFFKTIQSEPSEWLTDDAQVDPSIAENWVIKFDGDIQNPCEMTLPELQEKFGTTEALIKNDCTVNGVGNGTIFQARVSGISVKDLIDYLQPKQGANLYRAIGDEGYKYAVPLDWVLAHDSLLVTGMNGEVLPNTQGYPVASWVGGASGGDFTKRVVEVRIETAPADKLDGEFFVGQFEDPATGEVASKPNSAVLNYPSGVVLQDQAGKPVHLEGFADAWDEPITKVEYSLDHGESWIAMDVENCDVNRWVYWRLDWTPPEAGSYLLEIRTTSQRSDGSERVCQYNTEFLMNVR